MPSAEPAVATDHRRLFRWITPALLILGVQGWLILGHNNYGYTFQLKGIALATILAAIPPIARYFDRLLNWVRGFSPRTNHWLALVLTLSAAIYFPVTAHNQGRNLLPKWQDEQASLVQFRMLSTGRLWEPPHPLADFFDSFQIIIRPVYASMYFPGPALLYAPALRLHLPLWAVSSFIAGAAVGMTYLLMTELIDAVAGFLGALMLVATSMFREMSVMIFGYPLIVLLAVSLLYCWARWMRQPSRLWALLIGVCAGWAAITRPLDAVILAGPITFGIAHKLLVEKPSQRWLITLLIVAGAAPFLAVQGIFNYGVTGHLLTTPFDLYARRDNPGSTFGFHPFDPNTRPASVLPQKLSYYNSLTAPFVRRHTPAQAFGQWLPDGTEKTLANLLPNRMMILLLPAGVFALTTRRRFLAALVVPGYMFWYSFYAFPLPHYALIAWPGVTLLTLLGIERIKQAWTLTHDFFQMSLVCFVAILSVTETPLLNRFVRDERITGESLLRIDRKLGELPKQPAVVLFTFDPAHDSTETEPVYNTQTAWPDDARIIRANDLGPRDIELYRYYDTLGQNRAVYRYDRAHETIEFLGNVSELAHGR